MLLRAIVSFNDVCKDYFKKSYSIYSFVTNHSQKAFFPLGNQPTQIAWIAIATCKLLSGLLGSSRVPAVAKFIKYAHRGTSGRESVHKRVSEMRGGACWRDQLKCSVCSRWQRLTPVLAYRSIPQATTNHCNCSPEWSECVRHTKTLFLSPALAWSPREAFLGTLARRFCLTHWAETCCSWFHSLRMRLEVGNWMSAHIGRISHWFSC